MFDTSSDGTSYLVMELLEGEELERILRRDRVLDPQRAMQILLQIADALRAAHGGLQGEGVLHLDLKPWNVFVTPQRDGSDERLSRVRRNGAVLRRCLGRIRALAAFRIRRQRSSGGEGRCQRGRRRERGRAPGLPK